ncbi:hypothetical protein BGZ49_000413 [Haplosporangium sp. Z 27]|nr:hypothetical protein BGZ49_000413 [Haplosporangium sp. Z 27]
MEGDSQEQHHEQHQRHVWGSSIGASTSHLRNRQGNASSLSTNSDTVDNEDEYISIGSSTANRLHSGITTTTASPTLDKEESEDSSVNAYTSESAIGCNVDSISSYSSSSVAPLDSDNTPQASTLHHNTFDATTITTTSCTSGIGIDPLESIPDESNITQGSESTTSSSTTKVASAPIADSEPNAEFSCNICFDTSISPVLTLCGHLFCWSCLHQWLDSQRQNPTCPVCKAGCAQDKVIPIYGRGKEQVDPRSTTPKRPAGQRPEPLRNPQAGFTLGTGQVTFTGAIFPPFVFSPFGIAYGGSYTNMGTNGTGKKHFVFYCQLV